MSWLVFFSCVLFWHIKGPYHPQGSGSGCFLPSSADSLQRWAKRLVWWQQRFVFSTTTLFITRLVGSLLKMSNPRPKCSLACGSEGSKSEFHILHVHRSLSKSCGPYFLVWFFEFWAAQSTQNHREERAWILKLLFMSGSIMALHITICFCCPGDMTNMDPGHCPGLKIDIDKFWRNGLLFVPPSYIIGTVLQQTCQLAFIHF